MLFDATLAITAAADTVMCSEFSSLDSGGCIWVLMTVVPIGFYSAVSIVNNAMDCYNFIAAWNTISRTHRMDLEILHYRKNAIIQRRMKMDKVLDTRPYRDVFFPKEASCPVCLVDFDRLDQVSCCKDRKGCGHLFHQECLNTWLQRHPSCPCCRYEILSLPQRQQHPLLVRN